jgi:hypothetical protein
MKGDYAGSAKSQSVLGSDPATRGNWLRFANRTSAGALGSRRLLLFHPDTLPNKYRMSEASESKTHAVIGFARRRERLQYMRFFMALADFNIF